MIAPASVIATAAAVSSQGPLGGHLWHIVEGVSFLVISLGGIAIAESIQARRRRRSESRRETRGVKPISDT
jgi:hypothetical protein